MNSEGIAADLRTDLSCVLVGWFPGLKPHKR
jgi:hypothetical protein